MDRGAGFSAQLDTASDSRLGAGKWGLGPTAVALKIDGQWLYGGLINNLWSVAGDDARADVNIMLIQPFVNYNFPDKPGRYLTFAPIMTADWEADSGDQWTVPLGLGVGQIMKWGESPVTSGQRILQCGNPGQWRQLATEVTSAVVVSQITNDVAQ